MRTCRRYFIPRVTTSLPALAEAAALCGSPRQCVAFCASRRPSEGGRAGLCLGDAEPALFDERVAIGEAIEAIITALTEAKLGTPDDDAHSSSAPTGYPPTATRTRV